MSKIELTDDELFEYSINLSYLNIDFNEFKYIDDCLNFVADPNEDPRLPLIKFMKDPDNFYFTCKHILNLNLHPYQLVILREMWLKPQLILVGARGLSKSFLLAVYIILRTLFTQGCKVIICSLTLRQSRNLYSYVEKIWNNSPILRDIAGTQDWAGPKQRIDRFTFRIGDSIASFLPLGHDGTTIRGERANYIIVDEFASLIREVYEVVILGFASVSNDPMSNVIEQARVTKLKELGFWNKEQEMEYLTNIKPNQQILAGTAYFSYNHFFEYFERTRQIIQSQGNEKILSTIFPNGIDPSFDWRDYSIIRIPYELIPPGFMDAKIIAQAESISHTTIYQMEYGACFSKDSNGFFKMSLINSCTTKEPIELGSGPIQFTAVIKGNRNCRYIYGIDPATENDATALVIIELHGDHRRVVYCWTANREQVREKINKSIISDMDFYGYLARKVRSLMHDFPCELISIDSQGGGYAVLEALHDPSNMNDGEQKIYEINKYHELSDGKDRATDNLSGLHIVELAHFSNYEYTCQANHGMRKDMEDKALLFPYLDAISSVTAEFKDVKDSRLYDTLADCISELNDLKNELASIIVTLTPAQNREHWSTPDKRIDGDKKGRMRKDRYSALLMANMAARRLARNPQIPLYLANGGFAGQIINKKDGPLFYGPDWFTRHAHIGGLVNKE